jgi:hypothetical protein
MKQVIYMSVSGVLVLLALVAVLTLWSRRIKENDLNKAVTTAEEQTLASLEKGSEDAPKDNNEMEALFLQLLFRQINAGDKNNMDNGMKLNVKVSECDPDKGIISVKVDETFTYPGGKKGNVSVKRTALREREKEKKLLTLEFTGYKKFSYEEGTIVDKPEQAVIDGKAVRKWKYTDGKNAEFPFELNNDVRLTPEY